MSKSLLDTFSTLDENLKETLADLDSPLLFSFAALDIAANRCGIDKLTSEHIVACLEVAGVSVKKKSISKALARAGDRISVSKENDGDAYFRLMTKGKREIANLLGGETMSIVRIEGGMPRTARIRLGETLSSLKGEVRICDPYYGIRTLDSLEHISKTCKVRFLTSKTDEQITKINSAFKDYKKEYPNTEFRKLDKPNDLHDRYIVSNDILIILGHGLKDIGGKESFMISLDKNLVPDLLSEISKAFDQRWAYSLQI